jgi:hypothetical protein
VGLGCARLFGRHAPPPNVYFSDGTSYIRRFLRNDLSMSSESHWGWVGAGAYQAKGSGRRPAIVHASKECIESGRNLRTGAQGVARRATKSEAERARKCARCWG